MRVGFYIIIYKQRIDIFSLARWSTNAKWMSSKMKIIISISSTYTGFSNFMFERGLKGMKIIAKENDGSWQLQLAASMQIGVQQAR